jgi:hypothetical protein
VRHGDGCDGEISIASVAHDVHYRNLHRLKKDLRPEQGFIMQNPCRGT